jgi:uncharacterized protein
MQRTVGVVERMERAGRQVIRDYMPDQHRAFYAGLPFLVAGLVDEAGDPWATLLTGEPGFLSSPDARTLASTRLLDVRDPAASALTPAAAIGLLGIELHSRRRNRMNGTVAERTDDGVAIRVEHAFGNCPQYIQLRDFRFARDPAAASRGAVIETAELTADARAMIAAADTFFVASYVSDEGGARQVDASHRGGKAGFVRIDEDGGLTIPDFAGNLHFNTLGNFLINPRAGLIFPDFATGDVLQMTGEAEVILDSPEIGAFQGAERLWRFVPRRVVLRRDALPLRWAFQEGGWSPNALMTGDWRQAAERIAAERLRHAWRPFRIAAIHKESASVRSLVLEPADGGGLLPHEAGQHVPIRLRLPGDADPVIRTYTLSVAPSDGIYRISVKKEGAVSRHLHEQANVGDVIEARAPAGAFTVDAHAPRPAVLIGAGIGITPMVAMLRHIVYEGLRTRRVRPTWLFQSARTSDDLVFAREIDALVAGAGGAVRVVRVSTQDEGGGEPRRISAQLLRERLPFDDYDFYLCGPGGFMQSMYDQLRGMMIADSCIHAEAFGPSALVRRADVAAREAEPAPAGEPMPVVFMRSGKEARWQPGGGSLLDLAEARGLTPDYSCRTGSCGTCRTRILEGTVSYRQRPAADLADGQALICCAVPAAGGRLMLDL